MIKPNFQKTDTGIFYLYHYYPTRFHDHVGFSGWLHGGAYFGVVGNAS